MIDFFRRRSLSLFSCLVLLYLFSATATPASAQNRTLIEVPTDPLARPERIYVLPILFVPADRTHLVADPENSGFDVAGKPMTVGAEQTSWVAQNNLSVHLRVAQEKYRAMLRHPKRRGASADRGTFALATWDSEADAARLFDSATGSLKPLIHVSSNGLLHFARLVTEGDEAIVAEVLDRLGCHQSSCPFVLFITLARQRTEPPLAVPVDPFVKKAGGRPLNIGFNGGAGYALFPLYEFNSIQPSNNVLSTVLHELGHTFGLLHVDAYVDLPGQNCYGRVKPEKYSLSKSPSIMSYNTGNHTSGCFETAFPPRVQTSEGTPNHCVFPSDPSTIGRDVPGTLIAEDLFALGRNDLTFPQLDYDDSVELSPGEQRCYLPGFFAADIPGHATLKLRTASGAPEPHIIAGNHSRSFLSAATPYTGGRMWHSAELGAGHSETLIVNFPAPIDLRRLHLSTGYGSGTHQPVRYEVRTATRPAKKCALGKISGPEQWIDLHGCKTQAIRLGLTAGNSGHVVVRGLRFFVAARNGTREIFPPVAPITPP